MRRAALAIGLALLLAAASPAAAKEVSSAKVCGANGCHEVKDRSLLAALPEGGPPSPPPNRPSGWYRATLTISAEGARDRFSVAIVPASRYIRGRGELGDRYTWMHMSDRTASAYGRIARGLEPFPASKLRGLHQRPAAARVDQVVEPPEDPGRSGGFPWLWTLLGAGGAALVAAAVVAARRRGTRPRPAES
jgi:hypothetical protein